MDNPLRQYVDNPGPEGEHGDIWRAITHCSTRIAVVDERVRNGLIFSLAVLGFLVSVQLACLGLIVTVVLT